MIPKVKYPKNTNKVFQNAHASPMMLRCVWSEFKSQQPIRGGDNESSTIQKVAVTHCILIWAAGRRTSFMPVSFHYSQRNTTDACFRAAKIHLLNNTPCILWVFKLLELLFECNCLWFAADVDDCWIECCFGIKGQGTSPQLLIFSGL